MHGSMLGFPRLQTVGLTRFQLGGPPGGATQHSGANRLSASTSTGVTGVQIQVQQPYTYSMMGSQNVMGSQSKPTTTLGGSYHLMASNAGTNLMASHAGTTTSHAGISAGISTVGPAGGPAGTGSAPGMTLMGTTGGMPNMGASMMGNIGQNVPTLGSISKNSGLGMQHNIHMQQQHVQQVNPVAQQQNGPGGAAAQQQNPVTDRLADLAARKAKAKNATTLLNDDSTTDARLQTMNFAQQRKFKPMASGSKTNTNTFTTNAAGSAPSGSWLEPAIAAIKREGPLHDVPGDTECAIGVLNGKLVVRGSRAALEAFKEDLLTKVQRSTGPTGFDSSDLARDLAIREKTLSLITLIEEGPSPSSWIVAIDFDKTLAKTFLWADLGGLQGASMQRERLNVMIRDGRLKSVFGGDARIQQLREAIQTRLNDGDLVCVLSSGFASVIRVALQHVGLSDILPPDLIYGCDTGPYGISKSARLTRLKEARNRQDAILVDDDLSYCKQCLREGHKVIWVRDGCGMESRELKKLVDKTWDCQEFLDSNGRIGG